MCCNRISHKIAFIIAICNISAGLGAVLTGIHQFDHFSGKWSLAHGLTTLALGILLFCGILQEIPVCVKIYLVCATVNFVLSTVLDVYLLFEYVELGPLTPLCAAITLIRFLFLYSVYRYYKHLQREALDRAKLVKELDAERNLNYLGVNMKQKFNDGQLPIQIVMKSS